MVAFKMPGKDHEYASPQNRNKIILKFRQFSLLVYSLKVQNKA